MSSSKPQYPFSSLALAFPDMSEPKFAALVGSIRERGLLEPITVWRGEIIDGRHRYRACIEAGVEPRYQHLDDAIDPRMFVIDKNAHRRDSMGTGQRAIAAWKLSRWSRPGGDRRSDGYRRGVDPFANLQNGPDRKAAAELFHVSPRLIGYVSKILSEDSPATPEVRKAVEGGEIKVSDAARIIAQPAEVQREALEGVRSRRFRTADAAVKSILATTAPQATGLFRTIVVDPPWPTGGSFRASDGDPETPGAPTMTVEEIAGMELPLHENACVFLWAPQAWMSAAFKILGRWRLTYRFTMAWLLVEEDLGSYPPQSHLIFVVAGTRGKPPLKHGRPFSMLSTAGCDDPFADNPTKPDAFYHFLSRWAPEPMVELPEGRPKHWPVWEGDPV